MKMSIAVPTCESKGRGNEFLDDLFRTLEIQTFKDFEIVVSDHSKDDKLVDVIDEFQHKLNILYVKNKNDRGNGPANTNNAINHCSGDIIKVMFQDDFFYDDEALQKIYDSFDDNHQSYDLCLMSMCDDFIIANSSFSWWGAWLGNRGKVIAPKQWFGKGLNHNTKDLYCSDWSVL